MKKLFSQNSTKYSKHSMKVFRMSTVVYFCNSTLQVPEKKKTLISLVIYTVAENNIKLIELS